MKVHVNVQIYQRRQSGKSFHVAGALVGVSRVVAAEEETSALMACIPSLLFKLFFFRAAK